MRRPHAFSVLAPALALSLLAACGGSQPPPAAPPLEPPVGTLDASAPAAPPEVVDSGAVVAVADAAPAQKTWTDLSHEERMALMKTAVLPKMKEAFQSFDAKEFANFSCKTCHGEGIKQGKFDMPNPKLPKLDAKSGFKKMTAKHPTTMKFMQETVVPNMSQILGLPPWTPANQTGFGCGNCHVME